MTPEELSLAISACLKDAVAAGEIALAAADVPDAVRVERPKNREHGDWATNIALQLAKPAGTNPRQLAGLLSERLAAIEGVSAVDIAGPGFMNITVDAAAPARSPRPSSRRAPPTGPTPRSQAARSTWSSSRPTPPAPCTSATPAGPPWATRSPACSGPPARRRHGGVLHQRRRLADGRLRALGASPGCTAAGVPDGGYPGEYIADLGTTRC